VSDVHVSRAASVLHPLYAVDPLKSGYPVEIDRDAGMDTKLISGTALSIAAMLTARSIKVGRLKFVSLLCEGWISR
jgi:hypothetical protein